MQDGAIPADTKVYREDFESKLNLEWKVVRENKENVSLEEYPGQLMIVTERGSIWEDQDNDRNAAGGRVKNLYVIDNPLPADQSWEITTEMVEFQPIAPVHQAGLLIYEDDENYIKFVVKFAARTGLTMTFSPEYKEVPQVNNHYVDDSPDNVWLRIRRDGEKYTAYLSLDGEKYNKLQTIVWKGMPKQVGMIAKNGGFIDAPSIEARFEFFELRGVQPQAEEQADKSDRATARDTDGG